MKKDILLRIFERCIAVNNKGCLIWTGACNGRDKDHSYGSISVKGKNRRVHIVVYECVIGPVPKGLVLDHIICDNSLCVMPYHVKPVTQRSNIVRGTCPPAINAQKSHCIRGHEFTKRNTHIQKRGGFRICKTCKNMLNRKYRKEVVM